MSARDDIKERMECKYPTSVLALCSLLWTLQGWGECCCSAAVSQARGESWWALIGFYYSAPFSPCPHNSHNTPQAIKMAGTGPFVNILTHLVPVHLADVQELGDSIRNPRWDAWDSIIQEWIWNIFVDHQRCWVGNILVVIAMSRS